MWLIISILLIKYLHSIKFVGVSTIAISKLIFTIMALIYIDDTNIVLLNRGREMEVEIIVRA